MSGSRKLGTIVVATAFAMALGAPLSAQSTMYDPARSPGGHYHPPGELGDKLLIVEHAIKCGCGTCAMDVHTCQFQMQCDTSPAWTQRILTRLQAGDTPETIEAGFVADFGGSVLMTPPVAGFNLVGYLLPGIAILTAGMLIGMFAKRGEGLRPAPISELDLRDEEAERLRAELRHLDETEGPDW